MDWEEKRLNKSPKTMAGRIVLGCRSDAKAIATRNEVENSGGAGNGTELVAASGFDMNDPVQIKESRLSFEIR